MRILIVNHGYPMKFNAGSEIYTQNLVNGLLDKNHQIRVFSRNDNPFISDFTISSEIRMNSNNIQYQLDLINVARQKDCYQSTGIDQEFLRIIIEFKPDIVHINHLNHLSLGIIDVINRNNIPIIFTLHDFWLACPRGQFLQINYGAKNPYKLCDGQQSPKCAIECYSRYHTGLEYMKKLDLVYWTDWVEQRQRIISSIIEKVNLFISPSISLMKRMRTELPTMKDKIRYLDYGFVLDNLDGRNRISNDEIVFGYIGTHIVAKGIIQLLEAFSELKGNCKLKIYGRERPEITSYLKSSYPSKNIEWLDEYENINIITKVFNHVDVVVVPSIWTENSPLVIHEAQQVRIPVITANVGGMSDYVMHEVNGLLFNHRDSKSLREQMQRIVNEPELINKLGEKGYLFSDTGDIPSIQDHISDIISIYKEMLK